MKVPLSWLADFVDIELAPDELAERMTLAGLEVASIEKIGDFWGRDTVLVGEVVSVEQHPNADRLTLPTVAYGGGRTIRLVTGAPNIKVGMSGVKVPVALVGSRLIDGHSESGGFITLKPAKLRGVESSGMVCSERELGLSDSHGGILILPDDAPVGTPLVDYLGDTVFEVEPTPNLSRCLSILGVAREVAALTGRRVRYQPAAPAEGARAAADLMAIAIDDPELCARYCGTWVGGVSIGPSPFAVQRRLSLAGQRPISNIVDATNYVMLELGQPLHAFDYAALRERAGGAAPRIVVRTAREGEVIRTLDGIERRCTADTLLIADGRGPIALAGVMGGEDTEVREGTTEILLEAATFHHASIRRTAQRFNLPSQASLRFGKGLPASLAAEASARITRMVAELGGGEAAAGLVDCCPRPQKKVSVTIALSEFERVLGYPIPEERAAAILRGLEFDVSHRGSALEVGVPMHRLDVSIPADLVEEVARIEGYESIPTVMMADRLPEPETSSRLRTEDSIRAFAVASGLQEVIAYGMVDEGKALAWATLGETDLVDADGFMRVRNPLSEKRTVMRRSLLPGMLDALAANLRYSPRVAIFEIGRVFQRTGGERPVEPRRLGVVLAGPREIPWWGCPTPPSFDLFDLKGMVSGLMGSLHAAGWSTEASGRGIFRPGRGMELTTGGRPSGWFGELLPAAIASWDVGDRKVMALELELDVLEAAAGTAVFAAPGRFPPVRQDLAVVADDELPAAAMEAEIRKAGGDLLADVSVFDIYRGPQLPEGKKSVAFSLAFAAPDRTLTEEDVSKRRERIVAALQAIGATLR
jgi:phenylalanyl-tRNA synthetase beta chain